MRTITNQRGSDSTQLIYIYSWRRETGHRNVVLGAEEAVNYGDRPGQLGHIGYTVARAHRVRRPPFDRRQQQHKHSGVVAAPRPSAFCPASATPGHRRRRGRSQLRRDPLQRPRGTCQRCTSCGLFVIVVVSSSCVRGNRLSVLPPPNSNSPRLPLSLIRIAPLYLLLILFTQ